jgi:GeoRSP system PqqD family protein
MRPKRNPEVVWRLEKGLREMAWEKARSGEDFEDMGVLTLMHKGTIHQLNLIAAEIWTRINGIRTVEAIAEEIAVLFGWEKEMTGADVLAFLKGIEERGWVSLETGQEAAPPRWTSH